MSKFMLLFISIMVIAIIPLESFGETIEIDGEKYTITPLKDKTSDSCYKQSQSTYHTHGCHSHHYSDDSWYMPLLIFLLFFFTAIGFISVIKSIDQTSQ